MTMRRTRPPRKRSARAFSLWTAAATAGAILAPTAPLDAQETLRVAAYNIRHGRGVDDRVDLERLAVVLSRLDADVVTLQEVDDRTERTGRVDQVAVLADRIGYHGVHGPHRPYEGGFYGNAVLSRLPVRAVRVHAIPPAGTSALSVLEVEVEVEGGEVWSIVSVHLAGSVDERLAQSDALTRIFAERDHPVVLAGDLNGRPGGPVVDRLGSSWRVVPKRGDPRTYPAGVPDREIDYVLLRGDDPVEVLDHRVFAEPIASDHRPIVAILRRLPPSERP